MTTLQLALLTAAITACGNDSAGTADAPHSSDGSTADAAPTDNISGTVEDITGTGITGATVCVLHHADIICQTTDGSGGYTMTLPDLQGSAIAIEASATGYLGNVSTMLEPVDSNGLHGIVWPGAVILLTTDQAAAFLGSGAGFDTAGSGVGFANVRLSGALAGQLTGATASFGGSAQGPVYLDGSGDPDPVLTSSTSSGGVLFGDIAPGVYEVDAQAAGLTCVGSTGSDDVVGDWPPMGSGVVSLEVAPGAITTGITVFCQ